jgi:nicotinate-nucleotide pyrophosphorylase (carboxylating)
MATKEARSQLFGAHLPPVLIRQSVEAALIEDLGRAGDITSNATIPPQAKAKAVLATRQDGILCGMPLAAEAFRQIDPEIEVKIEADEGDHISAGDVVAKLSGNARAVLAAERVALNYLMRLSGIATCTARFQAEIAHTEARVTCTRKTIPGHRAFDKYAVKCGGGSNHRFGLDDAILIKDNHIAVAGGVRLALQRAREWAGHLVKVEIEVDTLDQFREALSGSPDVVLLDNMTTDQLSEAVAINRANKAGRMVLEASGNVDLDTIRAIAETGVDYISTSKITMAAPTLDLGLDIAISD